MHAGNIELNKIHDYLWEIPKHDGMNVPGRIYTSRKMIETSLQNDEAVKQVINVAHLPGIQKYSLAMPDIHWGYGFPIGGVAATDINDGVISPGGVGYDINCGVRLASTSLRYEKISRHVKRLVENLFRNVPTGVGASGAIHKLNQKELKNILHRGSHWAVENNFGTDEDIINTEENGKLDGADPSSVSERALERGLDQAGTLGSGNHFLELDVVEEIYNQRAADVMGLFIGQVVVMIHTGSRGLGYQICDDYLKVLINAEKKYGYKLPDRQLTCAPVKSEEGQDYLSAMKCAANFAWNNRQVIMHLAKNSIKSTLGIPEAELQFKLIYDVCHNIAKIEEHEIDGEVKQLCVHRKGATRAFPPEDKNIPALYRSIGQPVLIPGDMGRYSFIAVGTDTAMRETFGSSCHGAGRVKSRHQALKSAKGRNLIEELAGQGLTIQAKGHKTIAEEMPQAYKDVSEVVEVMHKSGISTKVAKLKPFGVIKG
ncbi:MAG: RtcB family protein [Melioribacteraceae bacterium]|nr:RtcB family protein [Melioribacteraceae bacterium]